MRTFKSKIDKIYHLLLWGVLALLFYSFWKQNISWAVTLVILVVIMLESFLHTEYLFQKDGTLLVRSGLLPKYTIDIAQIREIHRVTSPKPAYALSTDRLMIVTPTVSRMISPSNAEDFIKHIRRYNHLIKVSDERTGS